METIAGGKTPGLCLVEVLPAEVVALGISICDTTRDGSRIVGNPEVNSVTSAWPVIRLQSAVSPKQSFQLPTRGLRARFEGLAGAGRVLRSARLKRSRLEQSLTRRLPKSAVIWHFGKPK